MKFTDYEGIDYSMGLPMENGKLPNVDSETGIRYGVIHQNEVLQAWADSSEPEYPCDECEFEIGDDDCSSCDCEAIAWNYTEDGYLASSDNMGDIMILKSPFFTFAQFCSPCAPGACHLAHPLDHESERNKCYCFGHDWFDDGKAPYPVYSVETGELISGDES